MDQTLPNRAQKVFANEPRPGRARYGRALSAAPDAADRARGCAMVEASVVDVRALEMVVHANLAEQFLRELTPSAQDTPCVVSVARVCEIDQARP